jgi:hypothetical protein
MRGADLKQLPLVETTLRHWSSLYPHTSVVTTNTGFPFAYGFYPYDEYDYDEEQNPITLFPSSAWSRERPPKEPVLGVRHDGASIAFPYGVLSEMGVFVSVNETVGDRPIVVTFHKWSKTAMAFDRTVNGETLTLTVADTLRRTLIDAETGTTWDVRGQAIAGPLQGERLEPVADAFQLFWFAWSVFHPTTRLLR